MTDPQLPAGAWPSPITAERVASSSVRLARVGVSRHEGGTSAVWWDENRPSEQGRSQIVRRDPDGTLTEVLPPGFSCATRVHDYGGAGWWLAHETLFFINDADQRIWRLDPGFAPIALTPPSVTVRGMRYTDGVLTKDWRWIVCVAEIHPGEVLHPGTSSQPIHALVAVAATGGEPQILFAETDFVSSPRLDPESGLLAWITWDHPSMPWDDTWLWVAQVHDFGQFLSLSEIEAIVGGPGESVLDPSWDAAGRLWFASDRTDWWNLYRFELPGRPAGIPKAMDPRPVEAALPHWVFGSARYAHLSDGRVVCATSSAGVDELVAIDPATGSVRRLDIDVTSVTSPVAAETTVVFIGGSFTAEPAVMASLVGRNGSVGGTQTLRGPRDLGISTAYVSVGQPISYPTDGGRAHAIFYPPVNPEAALVPGERPPVVTMIHGGPTSAARAELRLVVQFWTSRGFAVVDVNHRGSTGFGRGFRNELVGTWGIVDVADCVAAIDYLADAGLVDGARAVIRGGSAGGFTTLAALAASDRFAAGASYYGVADLATMATDTHAFESQYLDGLIGPWPVAEETYRERSPITNAASIHVPVIVFQGAEDRVVPPNQAEKIVTALRSNRVPHAYVLVEGEGHGFRRAQNIASTLNDEWSFYCQVLDLPHPDDVDRVAVWRP